MTRHKRRRLAALCAAAIVGGLFAPAAARAQAPERELVAGVEVDGAYLVHAITQANPAAAGGVVVNDVSPFDPDGGLAIMEPGTDRREVFTYQGVDDDTSTLTGLVRPAAKAHDAGSFVQAVEGEPPPKPSESPSSKPRPRDRPRPETTHPPVPSRDDVRDEARRDRPASDAIERAKGGFGKADELAPAPRSFSTDSLVSTAAQLVALGWSEGAARSVYRPFPVTGPATFTNTWGAARYGPAPGQIRGHEGQDIFCDAGAPILAVTSGRIQFDTNGLGGRIARLRMRDGSYWYYAHLSGWNRDDFSTGDRVEPGDVIGYCGHSGDAKTTPDHLHFGWYSKDEKARNPMALLVGWLRTARARGKSVVARAERKAARTIRLQTLGRRFGDSWAPDLVQVPSPIPFAPPSGSPAPQSSAVCDPGMIAPSGTEPSATC